MFADIKRCGPTPLAAIKAGDVLIDYDTKLMFAEVNGDVVTWLFDPDKDTRKAVQVDKEMVGKDISTKAVGKMERMYITSLYKHPEGMVYAVCFSNFYTTDACC